MLRIKKLDIFIIKSFSTLFIGTFFICLFIFMMQFLWRYVDELVGKGLEMSVLAQFFFYSALSLVPVSLPLAVLLASLITFGNFGERYELLAMKAAGISLIKIMRPLIVFVCVLVGISFYFQNVIGPIAQVKLGTLLISMKQKSPEVDIPEGVFYSEIPGYNLKV
ncbi:MAG: LptF/LptG family permease, partial [Bacteroides sp.]